MAARPTTAGPSGSRPPPLSRHSGLLSLFVRLSRRLGAVPGRGVGVTDVVVGVALMIGLQDAVSCAKEAVKGL